MMNGRLYAGLWAAVLLLLAQGVNGQEPGPLELVEATVNEVVAEMNANQEIYADDRDKLRSMVYERVVPYFDFGRMTQLALGPHGRDATPEQRRRIRDGMIRLLVRTYASSMFEFRNEPIHLIGENRMGSRGATVRLSVTNTSSGKPVAVILRMENRDDRWQVIDVVVDGVSMVITYRGVFAEEISRGGIEGLIETIEQGELEQ